MGHDLQTPLLTPSAPPIHYPDPAAGYPQIPPGLQSVPPGYPAPSVVGVPAEQQQQQMGPPPMVFMHPHQVPPPQPQPPAAESHTVHVHVTDDPRLPHMHSAPRLHVCPACRSRGPTRVRRESGFCAWATAFAMCWVCCPLFWLPFCLDCDRDLVHRCSVCGAEVARVKPWN